MDRLLLFSTAVLLAVGVLCKTDTPTANNASLLIDGPFSAALDKMINPQYQSYKFNGNQWGRDGIECFVSADKGLLRFDLLRGTAEVLETNGGIMAGKTNENSAAIFIGTINGQYGYYAYDFQTNSVQKLMSLSRSDQTTSLAIAGKTAFFYTGTFGPPADPCTGIWDFWCSNAPAISSEAFYHIDRNTNRMTKINWGFVCFSKDGSKAILQDSGHFSNGKYMVAANTLALLDIFEAPVTAKTICFDDVAKYYDYDFTDLILRNVKTNEVINRYKLHYLIADTRTDIAWSKDGSKIYYMGYDKPGGNSVIAMVGLAAK